MPSGGHSLSASGVSRARPWLVDLVGEEDDRVARWDRLVRDTTADA
jgi:hypothetical protein